MTSCGGIDMGQHWLIIKYVLGYLPESNFLRKCSWTWPWYMFGNYTFTITASGMWLHSYALMLMTVVNSSPPGAAYIYVSESGQRWLRKWLVAFSVPSHYLNQCLAIVNLTLRIKFQWNFNQNIKIFVRENASEKIVCKMAAIWGWYNLFSDNGLLAPSSACRLINLSRVAHFTNKN